MASRRRPPPRPEPAPALEAPSDAAERTVISQMPVFEDEAPTPVPEVVVAPPRPAKPKAPTPRPAPRRALSTAPRPASSRKVAPPAPAKPRAARLGASAPPALAEPELPAAAGAPAPREATFVGLPVGLGAPPEPPAAPTPPPPAPRAQVSVSAAPQDARGPQISVRPAGFSAGARAPSPIPEPAGGLRLPVPGAAPAAPPVEPRAPSASAPAPRAALPLGFDDGGDAAPKEKRFDLPELEPERPAGRGTGLLIAAGLCASLVVGAFVFAGGDDASAPALGEAGSAEVALARTPRTAARLTPTPSQAPPLQPSSAVQRARRTKKKGASIARRRNRPPTWSSERVAALAAPGAEVPKMGGEQKPPREDFGRSYLQQAKDGPQQPMLYLFTVPPGMTIEVDGKLYGRTPLVRPLYGDVSRLDVRLSGPGYNTNTVSLRPEKDGSIRFNGVMSPVQ